ncbi:MAG: molybdopterin-guanine dinucleotide biosynthesis protein B [Candidatus Omnitrophica bacterium]|nr:molybdopterin-guanine dinucleotide biosynthesis protein B [Candidatus Omnitrophota bacterium]
MAKPCVVRVAGSSGSGKTTLIEKLIPRLRSKGLRVGTVKHAHHGFEMDHPGKDSWRHTRAGAGVVAVISPRQAAWVFQTSEEIPLARAVTLMKGRVDLILVEGFKKELGRPAIRLEPKKGRRLTIGRGLALVGVDPAGLLPKELERIADFAANHDR